MVNTNSECKSTQGRKMNEPHTDFDRIAISIALTFLQRY